MAKSSSQLFKIPSRIMKMCSQLEDVLSVISRSAKYSFGVNFPSSLFGCEINVQQVFLLRISPPDIINAEM